MATIDDKDHLARVLKPAAEQTSDDPPAPRRRTLSPAPLDRSAPLPRELLLRSGRRLTLVEPEAEDALLTVSAPDGQVELSVRLTDEGPVLTFQSAALNLQSPGRVAVDCEELELSARRRLTLRSGGQARVRGEDDVWLDGKNVLINCDPDPDRRG